MALVLVCFFCFKQKTAYEMRISDWSSDVCSSDLASFLKRSNLVPTISSPTIDLIDRLLKRGAADGTVRKGVDPLQLYVSMVALSYFHLSNGHTLSVIFRQDIDRKSVV